LDCYHFGSLDAGLLTIEGKLVKGVDINKAEQAISEQIALIQEQPVSIAELTKVKNKTESVIAFEDMSIMSRASSLAMYELMGDASLMNTELEKYQEINPQDIVDLQQTNF
jgi:zinc protease